MFIIYNMLSVIFKYQYIKHTFIRRLGWKQ